MSKYSNYKYCIVPKCTNTSIKDPKKIFITVPKNDSIRKKWCRAMKRYDISAASTRHVCEDHFDLEHDMSNHMQYKLQGGKIFLREEITPHKFECQRALPPTRHPGKKRKGGALVHFDKDQFENRRLDGRIKLKPNAIPTIFNISSSPERKKRPPSKSSNVKKNSSSNEKSTDELIQVIHNVCLIENNQGLKDLLQTIKRKVEHLESENQSLKLEAAKLPTLEQENMTLRMEHFRYKTKYEELEAKLRTFLSCEQIDYLGKTDSNGVVHWSDKEILKGMKMQRVLGKQGINYLRSLGYPIPAHCTLNRRLPEITEKYGTLSEDLLTQIIEELDDKDDCDVMYCEVNPEDVQLDQDEDEELI